MESTQSIWLSDRYTPRRPLKSDDETTIVIVGGGIVGVAAAYFLAQRKVKVVLLEKGEIGSGATGRSAGLLRAGVRQHYSNAEKVFSRDTARRLWRLCLDNITLIRELVEREHIKCDFMSAGSYRVALGDEEFDVICQSVKKLNQDGFRADIVVPVKLRRIFPGAPFAGAGFFPDDAEFHPVRFTRELAAAAVRAGARIYEKTPVTGFEGPAVVTPNGLVKAEMALLAVNALAPMMHPFFEEVIAPMRGQCFVTERFSERVVPAPVSFQWGMDTCRQLADGRFLIYGGRHVSIQTEYTYEERPSEPVQNYLETFLHERFPATRNLEVTHRFAGTQGFSCDELPSVGPVPGMVHTYAAVGFHGNGLSLGVVSARMAIEMMLDGRTEYPADLFSPSRHGPLG